MAHHQPKRRNLLSKVVSNATGMSVAEALIAGAIAALVIGLATTPMLQMKRLENQTDFQSQLEVAHQIALQKARNATFIKRQLGLVPGNEVDSCFGGRAKSAAVDCTTVIPATAQWEKIQFTKSADYKVTSTVDATITCTATKCSQIAIVVSTSQDATAGAQTANTKWKALPLVANFTLPAAALSSRQEIDYSGCVGKIITGINYDTLKAECNAFTGNNTCSTVTSAGPMMTFGQSNNSDPANCQVPQNSSCGDGFGAFGMINGQACAGPVVCTDPFSTACNPPTTTTTLCAKVWTPAPNTKCTGDVFTQTNNCDATTQVGTGTNNSLCPVNPCTSTASVKWPDAALGPCENTTVNISTAANSTAQVLNTKAGYVGSYTVSCTDNTPAPNTYDFANATKTCTPVVCAGLPLTLDWSATGIKSTVAGPGLDAVGPWPCQGLVTITNNPVQTPGTLLTTSTDPAAVATATHNPAILTASAGSVSATCTDPGPATAPHAGALTLGAISCTAPVTWNACMNCSDSSPQNAWYKTKGRCGDEEGLDYWKSSGPTWEAIAETDFSTKCGAKSNQQCFDDLLCGGHTYNMANNTCSKKVGVTSADGACLYGNCSGGCPAPAVTWPACNNKNDTSEQNSWYQSKGRHGETAGLIYWQNAGPNWKADAEISWATNCAGKTDKQCVDSSSCGGHTYDLATDTCKKNSSATSAVGTCFLGNCSSGCPAEPSWPACLDCSDTSPQNDWYKSKGRCGDAAGLAHWKADGPDWQAHAEAARASICGSAPNVICNDNTICGGHIYDFKTNKCYKFQTLSTNVGTVIGGNSLSGSCPVAPVPTYCLSATPSDGRPVTSPKKCMHSGACDPVTFNTSMNQTKCEDNGPTGEDPLTLSSGYRNSCESVGALTDSTCNRPAIEKLMGPVDKTVCSAEAVDGNNTWYKSGDDQWVYDGVPIGYLANTVRGHSPDCDSWKAKATIYTPGVYCTDGNVTNYQQTWSNEDGIPITAVNIPVGEVTWTSTETWNCGSESGSRTTCLGTGYIGAVITGVYPPAAPYPSEPQCGPSTAPVVSTTTTTLNTTAKCHYQGNASYMGAGNMTMELNAGDEKPASSTEIAGVVENGEVSCAAESGYDCRLIGGMTATNVPCFAVLSEGFGVEATKSGYTDRNQPAGLPSSATATCSGSGVKLICQVKPTPKAADPNACVPVSDPSGPWTMRWAGKSGYFIENDNNLQIVASNPGWNGNRRYFGWSVSASGDFTMEHLGIHDDYLYAFPTIVAPLPPQKPANSTQSLTFNGSYRCDDCSGLQCVGYEVSPNGSNSFSIKCITADITPGNAYKGWPAKLNGYVVQGAPWVVTPTCTGP